MFFPSYIDLGKAARELFTKGYHFGLLRVDAHTKLGDDHEAEFASTAVHTIATGKLAGNFDVKYRIPSYGVVFTEKWNTENMLGTIIEVQDQFVNGLKLTLDSWYAAHIGKRSARVKAEWVHKNITCNMDVGLDTGPLMNLSAVTGYRGWLLGFQSTFDVSSSEIKVTPFSNLGVSFACIGKDYVLHSLVNDGREFSGSFFHRVAPNLDIGAQFGWTTGDPNPRFGMAMKYCPTSEMEVKAKIDHESKFSVAFTHHLSHRVRLTLSSQVALAAVNEGHKYGLGLEFRPCC
ncbi:unnamed protein product [Gongylonema pulchrum]|uniref:Voltage-dependent anion-selective channel protein 3 n=1 Tax=Gongylonema pulchrum TaxID=637853 RepID=A0A183DN83_9BILA|nr:unnamed protein product [Gongylonema pulchrum]